MGGEKMLNIQIDEDQVKEIYLQKLQERMREIEKSFLFWDTAELKRQTHLSWNTIQKEFFFDPRFPKHKVGGKWMFPAEKTKTFLLEWIEEQPRG
jgi:hypothetical protein